MLRARESALPVILRERLLSLTHLDRIYPPKIGHQSGEDSFSHRILMRDSESRYLSISKEAIISRAASTMTCITAVLNVDPVRSRTQPTPIP